MRALFRSLITFFLLLSLLFVVNCGGGGGDNGGGDPPAKHLTSIAVTPGSATIPLGKTQQYSAKGTYSDGTTAILTSVVTWTSSETDIASINAGGLATSVATGPVIITASGSGTSGTATLTVTAAELSTIDISPSSGSATLGSTQQFTATGKFTDGHTEDVTSLVTWSSSNNTVARLLNTAGRSGLAIPRATGSATVEAESGAISGLATLTVSSLHPRFAYAAEHYSVSTYVVNDATGELRPISNMVLSAAEDLTLHPDGKLAFVSGNNSIISLNVDDVTGKLTKVSEMLAAEAPFRPVVHPSGKFLYQPTAVTNDLYAYSISDTGILTLLPGYPVAGIDLLTLDPTGRFAYGITDDFSKLRAYTVDIASGAMTEKSFHSLGATLYAITMDPSGQFLYVTNSNSEIHAYSVDAVSGALTEIQGSPFSAVGQYPWDVAVDPTGRYLFALCGGSKEVRSFAIADDGALTAIPGAGSVSARATRLAVDANGKALHVSVNNGLEIASFQINTATGALTALRPMRTNGAPASITVSRGQNAAEFIPKTLYVANAGDGSISAFPVSATNGVPNPPNSYLSNGNSTAVITDSLGKYLYAANWWDNRISGFSINPTTSVLTSIDTSPYDSGVTPSGLWFEPTGQYLYTTSWDQLVMMSFDHETGTLENVHSVTATGSVQGLASGGGGRYLYVLGSGSIAGFNISPYGSPTAVPWAPIKLDVPVMGSYARAITVDPTGNFLYVAITGYGNDSTDLQAFSINQMTGALTVIPGSPFTAGRNPISLATDAWGRYLYAGSYDGVQAFRINPLTGALTSIATYPLSGAYVLSLWADPSGRYLYAGAGGTDELRAYHIDSASGALTEVTGSPFSGVNNPWAITGTVSVK